MTQPTSSLVRPLLASALVMAALAACAQPATVSQPAAFQPAAIVPQVAERESLATLSITVKRLRALLDISGLNWDAVTLTLRNTDLIGGTGVVSQTVAAGPADAAATATFDRLTPGAGYTLLVALKDGGSVVGSAQSAAFTLSAGANTTALTVAKQGTIVFAPVAAGANAEGNATHGQDVVIGDAVIVATGIPTGAGSGITAIRPYLAPGTGPSPAIAAETPLAEEITDPSTFGGFVWRTATATSWTDTAWSFTDLLPAGLVGGALGGTTPATAELYFKLWGANGVELGQTAPLAVRVFQPARVTVSLQ